MHPLVLEKIKKSYGPVNAVSDVSFDVREGEIFGLIGPDGAGKTSIMRMIVSLLVADSGTISFFGKDVNTQNSYVRANIGYMPQRFSLYQDLSVEENLSFFGDLFNVAKEIKQKRLKRLYTFSKLEPFKKRFAGDLSGGMKQKLALSCMLMHEPKVMVLDEPTFGVDPVSRMEFWEILGELRSEGITLVVSTPYMDEAERCNRIGLINHGKLLGLDAPQNIINNFEWPVYRVESDSPHILYNQLIKIYDNKSIQLNADGVHIVDHKKEGLEAITKEIRDKVNMKNAPQEIKPALENIFLDLMQSQIEENE